MTEPAPEFDSAAGCVPAPPEPAPEPPMDRALRFRVLGVPLLTVLVLAFAAGVTLSNYLPTRIETMATEKELAEQERDNVRIAENIRVSELRLRQVETDRWTNERILRDDLHMTRKSEAILR